MNEPQQDKATVPVNPQPQHPDEDRATYDEAPPRQSAKEDGVTGDEGCGRNVGLGGSRQVEGSEHSGRSGP